MLAVRCRLAEAAEHVEHMARNLGHSAEGVAGSEIIASLKIQLKNS